MPINPKRYPPNWKQTSLRIRERENQRCLFCQIPNGSEAEKTGGTGNYKVVLTVAHLDHDETNWRVKDERLAALCQKCHLRYDAKEKARRRRVKRYKDTLFPLD